MSKKRQQPKESKPFAWLAHAARQKMRTDPLTDSLITTGMREFPVRHNLRKGQSFASDRF